MPSDGRFKRVAKRLEAPFCKPGVAREYDDVNGILRDYNVMRERR